MAFNFNNVLVTGGSGFVGVPLIKKLIDNKKNVTSLDIKPNPDSNVNFIQADIRDVAAVKKASKDVDIIFNLASVVPQSNITESHYKDVIVNGIRNVLDAAIERDVKVVHISSSGVYGADREGVVKEDDQKKPIGPYGNAKWEAELVCQDYVKKGANVVILRPMAIIGPGVYGVFRTFMKFVYKGYPLVLFGSGNNKIQLASLSDTVEALLCVAKYEKSGEAFNIGSDNIPTVKEEFKALIEYAHSHSIIIPIPSGLARAIFKSLYKIKLSPLTPEHYYMLDKNSILDITKAKKLLKWKPKKDNIQIMKETYDWFVSTYYRKK